MSFRSVLPVIIFLMLFSPSSAEASNPIGLAEALCLSSDNSTIDAPEQFNYSLNGESKNRLDCSKVQQYSVNTREFDNQVQIDLVGPYEVAFPFLIFLTSLYLPFRYGEWKYIFFSLSGILSVPVSIYPTVLILHVTSRNSAGLDLVMEIVVWLLILCIPLLAVKYKASDKALAFYIMGMCVWLAFLLTIVIL